MTLAFNDQRVYKWYEIIDKSIRNLNRDIDRNNYSALYARVYARCLVSFIFPSFLLV